jgi:hypothetical protein
MTRLEQWSPRAGSGSCSDMTVPFRLLSTIRYPTRVDLPVLSNKVYKEWCMAIRTARSTDRTCTHNHFRFLMRLGRV